MAGMPYLMLGGVGFWVYRGLRRQANSGEGVTGAERP
jgi:hypothetical protein